jgi:hypothetical protein
LIFYFYDKEINQVEDIKGNIPLARAFHSSLLIEESNSIIISGGILQNGRVSDEIFLYKIEENEFVTVNTNNEEVKGNRS